MGWFVEREDVRIAFADVARYYRDKLLKTVPTPAGVEAHTTALAEAEDEVVEAERDGDWVIVKAKLNAGEQALMFSDVVKEARAGEVVLLDTELTQFTRMKQYLIGWSATLADGKTPAPITLGALRSLDLDKFRAINKAIDYHVERLEAARVARKNSQGGAIASPAISPSPSDVAGASIGSEN